MSAKPPECWACGESLERRRVWSLDITERPNDRGEFAVTLCVECQLLVKNLLERIREAQFIGRGSP